MDYLELLNRADTGEPLARTEWDFQRVMWSTRELVDKFSITWDRKQVIPEDPDLVDRIFQAGWELACRIGVYHLGTGRVISFSATELEEGLRRAPQVLQMGEGADTRSLYSRKIMDDRPPLIWAGNPGVPVPENLFLPMVMSWMKEPVVDLVTCGSLVEIGGYEVRTGEHGEILATRRELELMRTGLQQAGRPGMGMLAAQSSLTELGDLAVSHPDYLRPCDAHLVPVLNELVVEPHNLARVVNSLGYGMRNASLACVMVGGLGGDAPGAAVLQTASFILANLVCRADYHLLHPIHIKHIATSTRAVMWVQSAVTQAFARNAPCIIVGDIYPKSGAMTQEVLFETAANALVLSISGAHLEGVGSANGALPNCSGLEARWMGEVGHAVTHSRFDLKESNRLVASMLDKYERIYKKPGGFAGCPFDQVYDLERLEPKTEWMSMYWEVKQLTEKMGLFNGI